MMRRLYFLCDFLTNNMSQDVYPAFFSQKGPILAQSMPLYTEDKR